MRKFLLLAACASLIPGFAFAQKVPAIEQAKQQQQAAAQSFTLVLITYVNDGNPIAMVETTHTVIGTSYTQNSCTNAAAVASGTNPNKTPLAQGDMLRVNFVCVPNPQAIKGQRKAASVGGLRKRSRAVPSSRTMLRGWNDSIERLRRDRNALLL
jgi:hypothetical protein